MEYDTIFFYVILTIFLFVLFPITQAYIITLDTSAWSFRGYEIVVLLVQVVPWLFLISSMLVPVYFIMEHKE